MIVVNSPRRRLWLYVPDTPREARGPYGTVLEIVMVGALDEIGPRLAQIKGACERWPGFRGIEIIGSGSASGILRMELSAVCCHADPLAEFLMMWLDGGYQWVDWHPSGVDSIGVVGTW